MTTSRAHANIIQTGSAGGQPRALDLLFRLADHLWFGPSIYLPVVASDES